MSAALLFLVQPMFAKVLLPLLGGAPAVWNTCVVFYELILLAGYAYAFALQRRTPLHSQIILHAALVLVVLLFLPLRIHGFLPAPTSATAVPWLLAMLAISLGLPLLVLSATSPLLQAWFSAIPGHRAHDPYFLYAASNAGSMLGLLAYPFLLEPLVGLRAQSLIWTAGYVVLVACLGLAGFIAYRAARAETPGSSSMSVVAQGSPDAATGQVDARVDVRRKLRWALLAFIPSGLMLSVTTYMSTVIAPIPLLWVVPLALYLLTFVIAFGADSERRLQILRLIAPFVVLLLVVGMAVQVKPFPPLIFLHLAAFFIIALTCHSLLAADRPDKSHLTEFYLWVAAGGAAGGIFVAIIAPVIFPTVIEYPLVLILAAFYLRAPAAPGRRAFVWDFELPLLLGVLLASFISLEDRYGSHYHLGLKVLVAFSIAAVVSLSFFKRPLGFATAVAALLLCSALYSTTRENRIYVERNFFGVHSVLAASGYHTLLHGQTLHGIENMREQYRDIPLSYYSHSGPLGQLFELLRPRLRRGAVAVVGLGVGSALCYQTPGQRWTIYEIDPAVDRIARDPRLFRFIGDCAPQTPTVLGDARLSLELAADHTYDLMILDAYSADYVPVHLITREAMALYIRKATEDGVLAFHTSSAWIDLQPVLTALASDADLHCYAEHGGVTIADIQAGALPSNWIALGRPGTVVDGLSRDARWLPCEPTNFRVWTDDYSSLVTAISPRIVFGR